MSGLRLFLFRHNYMLSFFPAMCIESLNDLNLASQHARSPHHGKRHTYLEKHPDFRTGRFLEVEDAVILKNFQGIIRQFAQNTIYTASQDPL
jgi:hypothetical protein